MNKMKNAQHILVLLITLAILGCESPQEKKAREEASLQTRKVLESMERAALEQKEKAREFIRQTTPTRDKRLGLKESDILSQFGPPMSLKVFTAKKDSFSKVKTDRYRLLGRNVKKMYYEIEKKIYIFWLLEVDGVWEVFADIETPPGTVF